MFKNDEWVKDITKENIDEKATIVKEDRIPLIFNPHLKSENGTLYRMDSCGEKNELCYQFFIWNGTQATAWKSFQDYVRIVL